MTRPSLTNPDTWWSFDVESTGLTVTENALMPWSDQGKLISYAVGRWGDGGARKRLVAKSHTNMDGLHDLLKKAVMTGTPIVGWNMCFDVAWLIKRGLGDLVKQVNWLDGMIIWRHLERYPESDTAAAHRKKYGLKAAVAEFLPKFTGYDDGVEFMVDQSPDPDLLEYNRKDAAYTLAIATKLFKKLYATDPRNARLALLTCKSIPMVAEHYVNGLHVDTEYAGVLRDNITAEMDDLEVELEANGFTRKLMASPAQLRAMLFDVMGLPVQGVTDKGAPSTDKAALFALAEINPLVAKVKKFRELGNLRTKFVDNIVESAEINGGTTHPTMNLCSTYTGRATFSSSVGRGKTKQQTGFAIHQMKRAADYRRIICAPPNHSIVEWDAAGQEYRWMAIISGDKTMLKLCEPGEDAHSYMAGQMSSLTYQQVMQGNVDEDPEAKSLRTAGKVGNLSCQYRIGVDSLLRTAKVQYGLDWDKSDARRVYNTYHATYKGVKQYWDRQIKECRNAECVTTLAGRKILLPNAKWKKNSWMFESASVNFPVQGIGADQKYLAIACLKRVLDKYGGSFFFELHDGIYAVFPDEVVHEAALMGKRVLDNLPYEKAWGFKPPIPLPFDIKIGPNWGDMKELR